MHNVLSAWRTREGTALLVFYGGLIAAATAAFAFVASPAPIHVGTPLWLSVIPVVVSLVLVAAVLSIPLLRAYAYRLQVFNVGTFLLVLVALFVGKRSTGELPLAVAVSMFCVQYAFMRWQDLVAVYAATLVLFAALAVDQGIASNSGVVRSFEILTAVALACVVFGTLRLRNMYSAAHDRFQLEAEAAELRRQTQLSARMAITDPLTQLLNRSGVNDLIDRALVFSQQLGTYTALLYIDLDGFKRINVECGHDAGDLALVDAALRVQYSLRSGEAAGRVGGDEFVIVLPAVDSLDEANALARRIEGMFQDPFRVGDRLFHLSASVGIALSSERCATRLELLGAVDKAMSEAKRWRKFERDLRPTPR